MSTLQIADGKVSQTLFEDYIRNGAQSRGMRLREMAVEENNQDKTIRERMAEEEKVRERVDAQGVKWKKVYFGGGEHFKNWLAQCRELGEVEVEEVNSRGYKCFEEAGEKLYRIWLRVEEAQGDDLF
jgi:argininosuccinate lyase